MHDVNVVLHSFNVCSFDLHVSILKQPKEESNFNYN